MSHPSLNELTRLQLVAGEICETAEAEGYTVEQATGLNTAFRDGQAPTSSLQRALVRVAARRGASVAGMGSEMTPGGGLDLVSMDGGVERRYRLKVVARRANGEYDVVCGSGSTLLQDDEGLWRQERWLLGFIMADDHTIDEIFVAQVVGHYGDGPVHLLLGPTIPIKPIIPPLGFTSTDEDLDDPESGEDEADTA